jgi:hypothetical protein
MFSSLCFSCSTQPEYLGLEDVRAVIMKISIFWNIMMFGKSKVIPVTGHEGP